MPTAATQSPPERSTTATTELAMDLTPPRIHRITQGKPYPMVSIVTCTIAIGLVDNAFLSQYGRMPSVT